MSALTVRVLGRFFSSDWSGVTATLVTLGGLEVGTTVPVVPITFGDSSAWLGLVGFEQGGG